jgi:uncharacterized SAM-binding protein YcdF (DUF218 family)
MARDPVARAAVRGGGWRKVLRWTLGLAGVAALLLAAAFVGLGHWLEAPAGTPSPADVIVLLGGDSKGRLATGVGLYRRGMAPWLVLAGDQGDGRPGPNRSSTPRLEYLLAAGVPRHAIDIDDRAHNSREEAALTRELMRQRGWRRVLVVSDPPHMRRLSWIWARAFGGADASYVLIAADVAWWQPDRWWADEWSWQFVRTEVAKIAYHPFAR